MTVEAGIASVLNTLDGLRVSQGWPDAINTDAAIVDGPTTYEDSDMAGCKVSQLYDITLLFSLSSGINRTRDRLMEYLAPSGPKSIRQALYADPTLGGNVQAFNWRGLQTPPGRIKLPKKGFDIEVMADEYYGAVIQIEIVV